jgi:hypothetical protein
MQRGMSSIIRKRIFPNFCRIAAFELLADSKQGTATSSASVRIFVGAVGLSRELLLIVLTGCPTSFQPWAYAAGNAERWPVQKNTFSRDR